MKLKGKLEKQVLHCSEMKLAKQPKLYRLAINLKKLAKKSYITKLFLWRILEFTAAGSWQKISASESWSQKAKLTKWQRFKKSAFCDHVFQAKTNYKKFEKKTFFQKSLSIVRTFLNQISYFFHLYNLYLIMRKKFTPSLLSAGDVWKQQLYLNC